MQFWQTKENPEIIGIPAVYLCDGLVMSLLTRREDVSMHKIYQ